MWRLCQIAAVRASSRWADAGADSGDGAAAVQFQVKLALEGVVDGLDELADGFEQVLAGPWGQVAVGGPQDGHAAPGKPVVQFLGDVAIVRDDHQAGPGGDQVRVTFDDCGQDLALIDLRAGQGPGHGQPGRGADQVQPQPPEEPRMGGAVAIGRPPGQGRAADRRAGASAFHRRGIHDPRRVLPQVGVLGQDPDRPRQQRQRATQPLVIPRLARQAGERAGQMGGHEPQPPRFGADPQQGPGHRQGQQLGIGEARRVPDPRRAAQPVIDLDVQCGQKGAEVGRHTLIFSTLHLSRSPTD
jgi:hypothetical protein